jgi:hypothetical protein
MKGKGNVDVFVLIQDQLVGSDRFNELNQSSKISSAIKKANRADSLKQIHQPLLPATNNLKSTLYPPMFRNSVSIRGSLMPPIREQNEERPGCTIETEPKLSKGDLESSIDSDDDKSGQSEKQVVKLESDVYMSPRRNTAQKKSRITATRIPSIQVLEVPEKTKSPYENEENLSSFRHLVQDFDGGGDLTGRPLKDSTSPGLAKMQKILQDEDFLANLSPQSLLRSSISRLSNKSKNSNQRGSKPLFQLTVLHSQEGVPEIQEEREEDENKSPELMNEFKTPVKERDEDEQTEGGNIIKSRMILLDTPEKNPNFLRATTHQLRKQRSSVIVDKEELQKKISQMGEVALQELRTPQQIKRMSVWEPGAKQVKRKESYTANRKSNNSLPRSDGLKRMSRDLRTSSFQVKNSMEDVASEAGSDNSIQNSDDEENKKEEIADVERMQEAEVKLLKNPEFLEEFKRKMMLRYPYISNLCLTIVLFDMIVSELLYFMDEDMQNSSGNYHIIYILIMGLILLVIIMKVNLYSLTIFKATIFSLFVIRLFIDFLEIYLYMPISILQKK